MEKQVLKSYRDLLKLARKWPLDESKIGRNLKESLASRIRENYELNRNEKNMETIKTLLEHANSEIESMNMLLEDEPRKNVQYFFISSLSKKKL